MMMMKVGQEPPENTSEPGHFFSGDFAYQEVPGEVESSAEVL
jgi:hypothetical protein